MSDSPREIPNPFFAIADLLLDLPIPPVAIVAALGLAIVALSIAF